MGLFDYRSHRFTIAGAGAQSIIDVGFPAAPKALMIFAQGGGQNVSNTRHYGGLGFTDGVEQRAISFHSRGDINPSNTTSWVRNDRIYQSLEGGGPGSTPFIHQDITFSAFTATGFDVVNANGTELQVIPYIAFGGTELEVDVDDLILTADLADNMVSGLPFTPDLVIIAGAGIGDTINSQIDDLSVFFGMHDGSNNFSASWFREDDRENDEARGGDETTAVPINVLDMLGASQARGLITITTDGFRVSKPFAPAQDQRLIYMALKGFQTAMGSFTPDQAVLANKDTVISPAFLPSGSMFMGDYLAAPIIGQHGNRFTFGAQSESETDSGDSGSHANSVCWSGDDTGAEVQDRTEGDNAVCFNAKEQAVSANHFRLEDYLANGFRTQVREKDTGTFPEVPVHYLMMASGSNNNVPPGAGLGTPTVLGTAFYNPYLADRWMQNLTDFSSGGSFVQNAVGGGTGGGGGGGGAVDGGGGGGGGAAGASAYISARTIVVNGSGAIRADGGDGGDGAAGTASPGDGGGGGAGGGGGLVYLVTQSLINNGLIQARAGNPGTPGAANGAGVAGGAAGSAADGKVVVLNSIDGAVTIT